MASIIPGFEYDIFISYRQKDNKGDRLGAPLYGATHSRETGWVSEFVEALKTELESTFKDEVSVFFDINPHDGLLETHQVDASLKEKLRCAVFIPVISRTYCDPRSFAWKNEFCAFNKLAREDKYGMEIKLPGGNVGYRILPVRIHDLDPEDNELIEKELGCILKHIEFIYRSPGVNRPLRSREVNPQDNLNKTHYRDQINKVANAVKELFCGLQNYGNLPLRTVSKTIPPRETDSATSNLSIIVLPFENFSPEAGQDYFSDGLTEEIIADLSQVRELLVISRSSSMTFRGANRKIRDIADEVNVRYVLEGSVRKAGNNIRITVQLIDSLNDTHLWAEKYTGTFDDVFTIQEKVSRSVVEALKIKLIREERKPTSNLKAYDLYLLGRYYWNRRTMEGIRLAINNFEQAVALDERFALAYAGLADAYYVGADWNYLSPADAYVKAGELARKAIMLDNQIASAYAASGGIADNFEYDYEKAESLYKTAISLNPNYATGYQWYADYLIRIGRSEEALINICKALQLDPLSPVQNFACGSVHYYSGDFGNAVMKFNETLKADPSFPDLRFFLFLCYLHKGETGKAVTEYSHVLADQPGSKEFEGRAVKLLETGGLDGLLDFIISLEMEKTQPSTRYLAIFHALRNNKEKALEYIEHNVRSYTSEYQYLNVEPAFRHLKSEPAFSALLAKVGYK